MKTNLKLEDFADFHPEIIFASETRPKGRKVLKYYWTLDEDHNPYTVSYNLEIWEFKYLDLAIEKYNEL